MRKLLAFLQELHIGWSWRFYATGGKVSNYHYFSDDEVAKWQLDPELWAMLDMARDKAGVPFIITSGKRSPDQNACLHGAVADSSHLKGLGVDIATGDDHTANRIVYGLCVAGLGSRRGEYFMRDPGNASALVHHHIHVDCDPSLPQQVTWALYEANA